MTETEAQTVYTALNGHFSEDVIQFTMVALLQREQNGAGPILNLTRYARRAAMMQARMLYRNSQELGTTTLSLFDGGFDDPDFDHNPAVGVPATQDRELEAREALEALPSILIRHEFEPGQKSSTEKTRRRRAKIWAANRRENV